MAGGKAVNGIHHVTALASDPQRNMDFYVRVLGLRLVTKTVNFDAPDVYHLYFGDREGHPGSILTFFPFPDAAAGKRGSGEITGVAFAAPEGSLEFWAGHLARHGTNFRGPEERFAGTVISFDDPDGMVVELVFQDVPSEYSHWEGSPIPPEHAVRKLHGVTMIVRDPGPTREFMLQMLGFRHAGESGGRNRYVTGEGRSEGAIDLLADSANPRGRQGAGSVHHIAWRLPPGDDQEEWRRKIGQSGLSVTPVLDRQYFQSVYFREPGGILFEIATDPPGFARDEESGVLGMQLKLPPWLEPDRKKLEAILPPLRPYSIPRA